MNALFWDNFFDGAGRGLGWSVSVLAALWLFRWIAPVDWLGNVIVATRVAVCGQ